MWKKDSHDALFRFAETSQSIAVWKKDSHDALFPVRRDFPKRRRVEKGFPRRAQPFASKFLQRIKKTAAETDAVIKGTKAEKIPRLSVRRRSFASGTRIVYTVFAKKGSPNFRQRN